MVAPILVSLQVGMPRRHGVEGALDPMDEAWLSGFWKEPVSGPVQLHATQLEGDGQADLVHHGGPDKAVLAYSADHYPDWQAALDIPSLPFGAFGENLSVCGVTEGDVCIGDAWRIGDEVLLQVSQPRQPCWKLARRWRVKTLPFQVQQTGRTGWYFRVLKQGVIEAGMKLALLDRPAPEWTIARANEVMYGDKKNEVAAAELAVLPWLALSWRIPLARRAGMPTPDATD